MGALKIEAIGWLVHGTQMMASLANADQSRERIIICWTNDV
jgi:hypothetical protein